MSHGQCLQKQPYEKLEVAERVAKLYTEQNKNGKKFRAYKCTICPGYHLSTKPLRKRK